MTISAKVIEDSITHGKDGKRLVTFQLCYPRFIHAEAKTHRVLSSGDDMVEVREEVSLMDCKDLSRNASSSRAIPVKTMIERTLADPAFFVHIGKNQPGMQANEEVDAKTSALFKKEWIELCHINANYAERWATEYGIHKQVTNRALEAWQHIHVVVTATEWANFMALRDHPDAQPEIHELARLMRVAMNTSAPVIRKRDPAAATSWHLPYVTRKERATHHDRPEFLARLSVARCARVSYLLHDGENPSIEKDLELYTRLVGSKPLHASPTEHQAYPLPLTTQRSNNFVGWRQFRETIDV